MTDVERPLIGSLASHDDLVNAVNANTQRLNETKNCETQTEFRLAQIEASLAATTTQLAIIQSEIDALKKGKKDK